MTRPQTKTVDARAQLAVRLRAFSAELDGHARVWNVREAAAVVFIDTAARALRLAAETLEGRGR